MTDLHAGHFGTAQLLLTYISHEVLGVCAGAHAEYPADFIRMVVCSVEYSCFFISDDYLGSGRHSFRNEASAGGQWVGLTWPFTGS